LYYNPTLAQYKLQGKSMENGLMRYVQEVGGTVGRSNCLTVRRSHRPTVLLEGWVVIG